MTHDIDVFGLSIVRDPKPNKGGAKIIANFDCAANGFELTGCALVRTRKNGLVVWMPAIEGKNRWGLSVSVSDSSLRHALMNAARDVYQAMGGTEAEWTPRDAKTQNYNYAAARITTRSDLEALKQDTGLQAFLASSKVVEKPISDGDANNGTAADGDAIVAE